MNLFGGFFISRLGGYVRYLYGTLMRDIGITKSPPYSLHEYLHGSNRPDDDHWDKGTSHEFVNRIVGTISIFIICFLIIYLSKFM